MRVLGIKSQQRSLRLTSGIDIRRRTIASEQFISSYTGARLLEAVEGPIIRCKQHLESFLWFISARVEGLHRFYRVVGHAVCTSIEIHVRRKIIIAVVQIGSFLCLSLSIINRDMCMRIKCQRCRCVTTSISNIRYSSRKSANFICVKNKKPGGWIYEYPR